MGSFIGGSRLGRGVLLELRRQLLRGGCGFRAVEMEVQDGWGEALRRDASALSAARNGVDAGSVGLLLVFSRGVERHGVLRKQRWECVCAGCLFRGAEMEV